MSTLRKFQVMLAGVVVMLVEDLLGAAGGPLVRR